MWTPTRAVNITSSLELDLGSSSHIQKILKSAEKQESENAARGVGKECKIQECNPIDAGLYKFKAWKLDSRILYSGGIFPKKLPEKQAVPIGFNFETEKRNQTGRSKEDKHFKFM